MSRVSLDSNILVYAIDASDADRHRTAKRVIALAARRDCVIVLQALAEFYYIATRKAGLPASQARSQVQELQSIFPVTLPGPTALQTAIDLAERYRINFWDAMLLAVARQAGVTVVLTEDLQDGQDYDGVRCVNPFGRTTAELTALLRR